MPFKINCTNFVTQECVTKQISGVASILTTICTLFDACVGPTQEYGDIPSALAAGNCRIGILEDVTLSSTVTLSQDTMIYVAPCATLTVADGGSIDRAGFNLFLWGHEDNTVVISYTVAAQTFLTDTVGTGSAKVNNLVFDDSATLVAFNWASGSSSIWENVRLTAGRSTAEFGESVTLRNVKTLVGSSALVGTLRVLTAMNVIIEGCEATTIQVENNSLDNIQIRNCYVSVEISILGDNSSAASVISRASITNCTQIGTTSVVGMVISPVGTANTGNSISESVISDNRLNSGIIRMGIASSPFGTAIMSGQCNSCQISNNNVLESENVSVEIYEPHRSIVSGNSYIDSLNMESFTEGSYNMFSNNNGSGAWNFFGTFADSSIVGNHIDNGCSLTSMDVLRRVNIVSNFILNSLTISRTGTFGSPERISIKENQCGTGINIDLNESANQWDINDNSIDTGNIAIDFTAGSMTEFSICNNNVNTGTGAASIAIGASSPPTSVIDTRICGNNLQSVGTTGLSVGASMTRCTISDNVSNDIFSFSDNVEHSVISGNSLVNAVFTPQDMTFAADVNNTSITANTCDDIAIAGDMNTSVISSNKSSGGGISIGGGMSNCTISSNTVTSIGITGTSSASSVTGNTATGFIATGSSADDNVVTGNYALGGFGAGVGPTGWTSTLFPTPYPNDLLDDGATSSAPGVGTNRV